MDYKEEIYQPKVEIISSLSIAGLGFESVEGCNEAKSALLESICGNVICPEICENKLNFTGVLLVGLPGVGKTTMVKAACMEASRKLDLSLSFMNIKIADLGSAYRSVTEKNVKQVFVTAEHNQPCVIFIDEIDSIMRQRSSTDDESSARVKSVLLDCIGELCGKKILLVGATNRVRDFDAAFIRRFNRRVHVSLPTTTEIEKMFRMFVAGIDHFPAQNIDFYMVAQSCDRFSGSEVKDVARKLAHCKIRREVLGLRGDYYTTDQVVELVSTVNPANKLEDILLMEEMVLNFCTDNERIIFNPKSWFEFYGGILWPIHFLLQCFISFFF